MTHFIRRRYYFYLLAVIVLIPAHPFQAEQDVIEIQNGGAGKWGDDPKISLEFVGTIGETESDDEDLLFYKPADIAFDEKGNIFVLDAGNHRIQKFSPDGDFLASYGRKGQGPGEFQMPVSIDFDDKGRFYIPDVLNQRIEIFSPEGILLNSVKMHKHTVGPIRLMKDNRMLMGTGGTRSISLGNTKGDDKLPKYLKVLDATGTQRAAFGEPYDYKDMILNSIGNDYDFAVDGDGNIYSAFHYQNRIEKFSPEGRLLWRAHRDLGYSTEPPKERSDTKISGNQISISMPHMNQCCNGIAVDEMRRVWVVGLKSQDMAGDSPASQKKEDEFSTKTDIFQLELYDNNGRLLHKFPLTHYVDDIRCHRDKIYLLDADHTAQVYVYRIIEKGQKSQL